jgi:hypothetical protein
MEYSLRSDTQPAASGRESAIEGNKAVVRATKAAARMLDHTSLLTIHSLKNYFCC